MGRGMGAATDGPARALAHLLALARCPRPAGSEAEGVARAHAARALVAAGYAVHEEPFAYSAAVGEWGTPVAGVVSMAALAAAAMAGARGRPGAALTRLGATLLVGAPAAAWAARRGVLDFPALRRRSVNLVAVRGSGEPAVWLVAHLDSKSQPVPIGVRAAGVAGTVGVWAAALALAAVQRRRAGAPRDPPPAAWWRVLGALGVAAGVPVAASVVTARSPGALDNASGSAAVLLAAEQLAATAEPIAVGVLLTSAEELGLAGARAWARARQRRGASPGIALNCDGVDDGGRTTVMLGARADARLVRAVRGAAAECGTQVRVRRLVPGILVDAVALAAAGWATLTVSRGSWRTLARIHLPDDTVDRLDGRGVVAAAAVLSRAAVRLARPE